MRRNRAAGDQIDEERAVEERPRPPAALTPAPTREEEAELIAERLAALVASRKASGTTVAQPPRPPVALERAPEPAPQRAPEPARRPAEEPAPPKLAARKDRPSNTNAPVDSGQDAGAGVEGARHTGRLLGNLLVTRGFVHESELQYALSLQAQSGHPIGQILVELGLISENDLVELLAEQRRMQVMDPARVVCDEDMLDRLPKADAHRLCALPIRLTDGKIDVVIADPSNGNAVAELMNLLGGRLRLFLATRVAIDAAIDRVYA